jgi:hypothetical protein
VQEEGETPEKKRKMKERKTLERCLGTGERNDDKMRKRRHQTEAKKATNKERKKERSNEDIGIKVKVKHFHYMPMGHRGFWEVKAPRFRDIGT